MDLNAITSALQSITGSSVTPFTPSVQETPYNAADYTVPSLQPMLQAAYKALAPYYKTLLDQNNNDMNQAITNLQTDTNLQLRQAKQTEALTQQQQTEDLASALEQLTGVTFPKEKQALADTLNKRGIATTEKPGGGLATGTAASGEAGYEAGQLSTDQQLRQEATNRAAQRNIQQAQITYQNTADTSAQKLAEGTQSAQQAGRTTAQNLAQNMQGQALTMAQTQQNTALAQEQMNINKQQNAKILGAAGLGGGSTTNDPTKMTQAQRQTAFEAAGNKGIAPIGFGG